MRDLWKAEVLLLQDFFLIHFISMNKVKDILRVEALLLRRFLVYFISMDKVRDILRVEALASNF